jgi:hypothetical protein
MHGSSEQRQHSSLQFVDDSVDKRLHLAWPYLYESLKFLQHIFKKKMFVATLLKPRFTARAHELRRAHELSREAMHNSMVQSFLIPTHLKDLHVHPDLARLCEREN